MTHTEPLSHMTEKLNQREEIKHADGFAPELGLPQHVCRSLYGRITIYWDYVLCISPTNPGSFGEHCTGSLHRHPSQGNALSQQHLHRMVKG